MQYILHAMTISACVFSLANVVNGATRYAGFSVKDPLSRIDHLVLDSQMKWSATKKGVFLANPLADSDVPYAIDRILCSPCDASYHLLMALREYYPSSYKAIPVDTKLKVLLSSLKNVVFLNDWGSLEHDARAAKAVLEIGKDAIPMLKPILDVDELAPIYGSGNAMRSHLLVYRRKDYAFRYIVILLTGTEPQKARDPFIRDIHIRDLKRSLERD